AESIPMLLGQSLFLWPPGNGPVERLLGAGLGYAIDFAWPKRRIVEVYLNVADWGGGVFGAESAAMAFFNKSAAKLSRMEAAQMVAALADPRQLSAARSTPQLAARAGKISAKIDASRFDYSCVR